MLKEIQLLFSSLFLNASLSGRKSTTPDYTMQTFLNLF
jgi:hypothetical protein